MTRKIVDIAVIIPDASPILTLARVGRLDLLGRFGVPIKIVDQVLHEATRERNDPDGAVASALRGLHNRIEVIETNVGVGYRMRSAANPAESSANLGEIAVEEYATALTRSTAPGFIPLVLFEDPDVLQLRVARLKDVHLLNTSAWLLTLHASGVEPDALDVLDRINAQRKTPMQPFEKPALTKKVRSAWIRRTLKDG